MFDPSGQVRQIPSDQVQAATQAGGKPAVKMLDPQGTSRWIPQDQQQAALAAGGKLTSAPASPDASSPGLLARYGNFVRQHATVEGVKQRLAGLNEGIGQFIDQASLPMERGVRNLTGTHMLDNQIAHDEQYLTTTALPAESAGSDRAGGQEVGRQVAQVAAFEGGGKVLDTVIEGLAGTMKGASMLQRIKELGPIAKALEKSPQSLAAVGRAMRNATVAGGLEAAQGGDAGDIASAALVQGAAGGVLDVAPAAMADAAKIVKPGVRTIAGVEIPELASQRQPAQTDVSGMDLQDIAAGKAQAGPSKLQQMVGVADRPEYQAAQQEGGRRVIAKTAQDAVRGSIERLNATRPQPISDPARMLPAPEDMKPFQFTIDGPGPTEDVTQPSQAGGRDYASAGTREVPNEGYRPGGGSTAAGDIGTAAGALPERSFSGKPTRTVSNWQEMAPSGEDGSVTRGGGGTISTSDPTVAHQTLAQMEAIMEGDKFQDLSGLQQRRIAAAAENLRAQIEQEGAYRARMGHFAPVDAEAAAARTHGFAEGAAQLEGAVSDVWSRIDEASGGRFRALRNEERDLQKTLRNPESVAADTAARTRLDQVRADMGDIFATAREQIHPSDVRAGEQTYKDASTLHDLETVAQRSYRGAPTMVAGQAGTTPRTFKGGQQFDSGLDRLLQRRGPDVERVIGKNGVLALSQVNNLLTAPETSASTKGTLHAIGTAIRHHAVHLGSGAAVGWAAGHVLAHVTGGAVNGFTGAASGVAVEAAIRRALAAAATNPAIADRLSYAVKNNVSHRIAAPLIASMMLNQQAPPPQQQQPTGDPAP